MQFYSPYFLNLLWLVPVLVFFFFASGFLNSARLKSFLKTREIQDKLLPHYNRQEWPVRGVLLLSAFLLVVLALAQPQWGEEKKRIERKGVDLIFLLDVSASMLAEDIKPSRVRKAKFEIEAFVKELRGHRIGLLTFAGSSFMQTPLTLDYSAFLIFLSGVDVGHVPDPGTSLGAAIERAVSAFSDEKGMQKALIVFSDGEDHAAQIDSAIALAKQRNVRIYCIGTATGEGAPIPLKNESGVQTAVKKDRSGNIVITKLDRAVLSKVATETGGIYLPATPGEREVDLILKHLASLGEKKLEDRIVTEKEDHYQIFVFIALVLLILEMLVRRGRSERINVLPVFFFVFIIHSGFISTPQSKVEEGNKNFEEKKYQSAIEKYREVQVKNPDDPAVAYNLATSLYKTDQYQESAAHLKKSMETSAKAQDKALQAKIAYNYGNALFRLGDYEGAVEAYKKALEFNPQDQDSKYNLEFIQDQKSKFEKENQDRKKDNQDKKDDQNKQQDNKNQQQDQQKNQQSQGGGGGSKDNQDQNQGQDQQNQSGSGQQDQKQNQGGQGQDQQNSGQNQGQDQKDQGQGQKDKQGQGDQSDQNEEKDQGSGGGQDEKKDEQQGQGGQGQDKEDQNGDEQQGQDQNQGGPGQQDQKEQQHQDQPQNQGGQGQERDDQAQKDGAGQQPDQKPGSPKPGEGPQQPQGDQSGTSGQSGGSTGTEEQLGGAGTGGQPLQGQMSKENAEYLLASLEEGEKNFQVMRKPAANQSQDPYIEKDW